MWRWYLPINYVESVCWDELRTPWYGPIRGIGERDFVTTKSAAFDESRRRQSRSTIQTIGDADRRYGSSLKVLIVEC
jgi:hypothetical protein